MTLQSERRGQVPFLGCFEVINNATSRLRRKTKCERPFVMPDKRKTGAFMLKAALQEGEKRFLNWNLFHLQTCPLALPKYSVDVHESNSEFSAFCVRVFGLFSSLCRCQISPCNRTFELHPTN